MRTRIRCAVIALSLVVAVGAAAKKGGDAPVDVAAILQRHREAKGYTVGRWAYSKLTDAQKAIEEKRYDDALEILGDFETRERLNDHERALYLQATGFVWGAKENYLKAAQSFERCLTEGVLPEATAMQMLYNLGQMYLGAERYGRAAQYLSVWIAEAKNPRPDAHYLLAVAYTRSKQSADALRHIGLANRAKKKPPENWLNLQLSLYLETHQYKPATLVLSRLIGLYPKKNYWLQLSGSYEALEDRARALAVLEIAYRKGVLEKPVELMTLAHRFMDQGIPIKAAAVVEAGMRQGVIPADLANTRFLANALLLARELDRALEPLERAAQQEEHGHLYVQLAQIHLEAERWPKAIRALHAAQKKGGLKNPGQVDLLLGIAHYSAGDKAAARSAFARARGHAGTRAAATQWMKMLTR